MRLIDADELMKCMGRGGFDLTDATDFKNKSAEQQEWSYSTLRYKGI